MAHPDKNQSSEIVSTLLEKSEVQGYLTMHDLIAIDMGEVYNFDELADLVEYLSSLGVKIVVQDNDGVYNVEEPEKALGAEHPFSLEGISTDDSVSLYLREMSVVPLLSFDEEVSLAKSIERASSSRREFAGSNGRIKAKRRQELERAIQEGFKARENLIKANTRLVVSIARRHMNRGVPFLDLIQEGNMGLMRAVEKYEYQRGFRFSTYATWWIRQSIVRAIAYQGRTIRVPVHMFDRLRLLYKISREFEQAFGRLPNPQELADHMGSDEAKVRWMLQVAQKPISLESPVGDDEDSEFGMLVEDSSSPSPAQLTYQNMLRERVEEVLSTLSPREARILRLRFGLGQDRVYTLEEVGRKFGLTRERIRQIEGNALRRLRHPGKAGLLRDYV